MQYSSGCSLDQLCKPQVFPLCELPPCNCEKCQEFRTKLDAIICDDVSLSCSGCALEKSEYKPKTESEDFVSGFTFNFHPSNIYAALFDVFGIIAFIIMSALTFWIMVCSYVWTFSGYIYRSGRNIQIFALVFFFFLLICIAFHAITGHKLKLLGKEKAKDETIKSCSRDHCQNIPNKHNENPLSQLPRQKGGAEIPQKSLKAFGKPALKCSFCNTKRKTNKACGCKNKASDSLCSLCAKFHKPSYSDYEIRRIYEKFKLYSIPTEWKTPPSIIVLLIEYLWNIFGP